jgi:hypothetical protein
VESLNCSGILNPFTTFIHGAHVDALFQGTGTSLPPEIILDFMYGVATYKHWGNRQSHDMMDHYFRENYEDIAATSDAVQGQSQATRPSNF